mgnify:CR=1 FL=1
MERKHHLRKIRNKTSNKLDYILLGIIIAVAAVLRLWKLGQVPFMHDEFSALIRTDFDNLHDLVTKGIIADTHPAGVQFFLFLWAKIFGWSEFWIKLPFALMGIASIYLVFKVGKQWFNNKVGLLAAAFFAVSQFTVFYSQLARPYIAGMFFVLLFAVFWNKILFDVKKPSLGTCIGFAVAAALAALAHSFSTAQAGLMFLTGLFFLPKERRKAYWLSGVGALALYSPNFPIFYHQLIEEGGIGGWLAMPKSTFLIDFVQYTMNYSPLFIFATGIIIILPIILQRRQKRSYPIRWAAAAWFIIAFGMAYIYSLLREPILQQSTMIFSYPFLVIIAFSLFKNNTMTKLQTIAVVAVILFAGTSTLITTRGHYEFMYHQGFDQIAAKMQDDSKQYGEKIHFATRSEIGTASEFYQAQTDVKDRIIFDRYEHLNNFTKWMHDNPKEMLGFGWTDYSPPIWETTAVGKYPYLVYTKDWFTSRYLTLSKQPCENSVNLLTDLNEAAFGYVEGQEWNMNFVIPCDSLDTDIEALGVVANIHHADTLARCTMVIELHETTTDSLLFWHSSDLEGCVLLPGDNVIADAIVFSEALPMQGTYIKAYLWNQDKKPLTVNKIGYHTTKRSPVLTGLYEPLN